MLVINVKGAYMLVALYVVAINYNKFDFNPDNHIQQDYKHLSPISERFVDVQFQTLS